MLVAVIAAVSVALVLMTILIAIGDWLPFGLGQVGWVMTGVVSLLVVRRIRPDTSMVALAVLLVLILGGTATYSVMFAWYVLGERL